MIRFDYGRIVPWVRRLDDARVAIAGPDGLSPAHAGRDRGARPALGGRVHRDGGRAHPVRPHLVPVAPGRSRARSTRSGLSPRPRRSGASGRAGASTTSRWPEAVRTSLLVLKALTYAPTGGIVAARRRRLPEAIGGVRNWDYRFCWLRDATLTLLALLSAGYVDEATAWRDWLLRAIAGVARGAPDHVRRRRRAPAAGARARLARRATRARDPSGSATAPRTSSSSTSTARSPTRCTSRRSSGLDPSLDAWRAQRQAHGLARDRLARAGRGHLGGARAAAALHALEGDGLGRVRPRGAQRSRSSGATGRSSAGGRCGTRCTGRSASSGSTAEVGAFTQSYGSDRVDASALMFPLVGFLDGQRPAHGRHRRRDRARAPA